MSATEKTGLLTSQVGDLEAPPILPLEEDTNEIKEVAGSCSKVWKGYVNALDKFPVVVKSVTAFLILATADATGQLVESIRGTADSNSLDVLRMLRFGLLGLCGTPFFHYYFMWLDHVLPPTPQPWTRRTFIKLFIDQGLQAPCTTLAIFVFVGLLEGKTFSELGFQLKQDYLSTLIANWKLFVPAQLINLAFCPPNFRVLFINMVFFFWSIILSVILHKDQASAS